jgi:hypothetical protein
MALGLALLVILFVSAFGMGSPPTIGNAAPASASRLLPQGPPASLLIARYGDLGIQLPVNENNLTAIGYHGAGEDAFPLTPVGRQLNEGFFSRVFHRIFGGGGGKVGYYRLGGGSGPSTGAVDVGAAPGIDVYSPVEGTVVGLRDYVVDGRQYGSVIEIQPRSEPSVVVWVTHVRADPLLRVGTTLSSSTSKIGTVVDLSKVERQALARYTQDAGNHVSIETHPASNVGLS